MVFSRNDGIVQSGGSITATNLAVGTNATITQTNSGQSDAMREVQKQIANLLQALEQYGHEIANRDDVMQSAQTVKQELAKEKPNHLTLKSLLSGIADSVKSVASIATAVEGVKVAVAALFG
jgi:Family of unknown function (DUF5955)